MPKVAQEGGTCPNCAAPMAADQRYCLSCGARRGEPRLPFDRYLGSSDGDASLAEALARASARSNEVSPLGVVLGIALLGGMLVLGVLLGRDSNDDPATTPTVAQTATEIPGAAPATPDAEAAAPETDAEVVSEWPAGTDGFTVELGTLPKDGTTAADVEATKAELTAKGAAAVGVLDSDLYPTLPPSTYVLYSGVYTRKAEAETALETVIGSVPEAVVVKVSESAGGKSGSKDTATPGASEIPPVTESEVTPSDPTEDSSSSESPSATGVPPAVDEATAEALQDRLEEASGGGVAPKDGR